MSTKGLSLGLVLLCLLRVQAGDLGSVEPDESKVTLSGKGREGSGTVLGREGKGVVSSHQQCGEDCRDILVLGTAGVTTATIALLSHLGEDSHPVPP